MAFVVRSERRMLADMMPAGPSDVGPGSYIAHHEYRRLKGTAPFGSTESRNEPPPALSLSPITGGPGPGTYDPQLPSPAFFDPGLPRRAAAFHVSSDRWDSQSAFGGAGKDFPGPGAYNTKLFSPRRGEKGERGVGAGGMVEMARQGGRNLPVSGTVALTTNLLPQPGERDDERERRLVSAPSIPAYRQCFGYEEDEVGRLVRQPCPENWLDGTPRRRVGPGEYMPNDYWSSGRIRTDRALNWSRLSGRRDMVLNNNPGPGTYTAKRLVKPSRLTSAFASGTRRAPPGPLERRVESATPARGQRESTESLAQPQSIAPLEPPGPGAYEFPPTIQPKRIAEEHQFFGTSAERFPRYDTNPSPGPAAYAVEREFLNFNELRGPVFSRGADRFQPRRRSQAAPGPGAYNLSGHTISGIHGNDLDGRSPQHSLTTSGSLRNLVRSTSPPMRAARGGPAFGGSERRFCTLSEAECPGPGAYDGTSDGFRGADGRRSAAFASKARRLDFQASVVKRAQGLPSPADYVSPVAFVSCRPKHIPTKSEGFLSTALRDVSSVPPDLRSRPGPGQYESEFGTMQQNRAQSAQRYRYTPVSAAFSTSAGRFAGERRSVSPGPGEYDYDRGGRDWTKQTFNCLFGDVL
ncbi:unnamed protein product [Vitrella brassicaformis CCMP3155]|uniref:Sperm-tail PG-rich repeat-containing protein 2 n=2 Tax=Vitrella brassicaformis TaxID=1169539 RepID=A0A0G4EBV9_VITBC|nr:unnamed protein product [Vitrella brassicaformis CCMP3155]|eukprot:CEL92794.1 unnamed protein product [Vitrella brassicaformis CCMP3155]